MKLVLYLLLALFSFALTVGGMLAYAGALNKEGIDKLLGRNQPVAPVEVAVEPDALSKMAKALREREDAIAARELDLKQQQERLSETQNQMEELRSTLEELIGQLTKTVDTMDADKMARLQEVAKSLGSMKEDQAAIVLEEWPAEQGARLLQLIDPRKRGKILDKMNEVKASEFLREMSAQDTRNAPGRP